MTFRRILVEALAIVILGAALGLTFNYRLILDLFDLPPHPSFSLSAPATETVKPAEPAEVGLAEVRTLLAGGAVLIDARPAASYAAGHLPGALSLPLEAAGAEERRLPRLPADRALVVYCGGYGCGDAFELALLLGQAGYRDLRVFSGGYPEWVGAGLPIEKGAP